MQYRVSTTICGMLGARKSARLPSEVLISTSGRSGTPLQANLSSERAERFYAELSDNNRELLVNRAVALYDGKATREEPHDEDVYVCDACGSRKIEIQVWVNANTNEYLSDVDDDDTDCKWCADCEQSQNFCTLSDYKQRMQDWWKDLDFITMESITGLREADHSAEDGSQSFVDACNDWWNGQDYDTQRELYFKSQS